jgi:hypothetical protein
MTAILPLLMEAVNHGSTMLLLAELVFVQGQEHLLARRE